MYVCVCFQGVARHLYARVLKRQQTPIAQLLRLYLGLMHNIIIYKINYVCISPRLYFGLRHIIIIYSYYSYIYMLIICMLCGRRLGWYMIAYTCIS